MEWLKDLYTNPFLIAAVSSWLLAQVLKLIIHTIVNRKFDIYRLFGDGGMPSGHSATVTSLAVMCALICGTGSAEFALSAVFVMIVCHDAMGVRLETGKQALVLNEMAKVLKIVYSEELPEVKLKEFVGHTPTQVLAGMILGAANAVLLYHLIVL